MSTVEDAPTVAVGYWLYDGGTELPVRIVALPYDHWYELGKADEQLEPGEEPTPLGPEGVLYYASFTAVDSSGYPTVPLAKEAAQKRVQSQIHWES